MSDGGQRSQDQRKRPTSRGRWKEVSNVVGDLGSLLKDTKSTWQKSCKESMKKEQEVLVFADELKAQGNVDENTRAMTIRVLKRIRKIREEKEEEAAKELLEYILDRKKEQEDEMWKAAAEYIGLWDTEKRRTCSSSTNIWQLAQSSATKAENLENDFTETTSKVKELGWWMAKMTRRQAGTERQQRLVKYFR